MISANIAAGRSGLVWLALSAFATVASGQQSGGSLGDDRPRISGALTVQKAVDTALRGNLEVQASQAEAEAAGQETRAARSMTRPQLSANTYLSAGSMPNILGT